MIRLKLGMKEWAIAKELVDAAMDKFKGIYLITPFLYYGMTVELTKHIRKIDSRQTSEVGAYE